MHHLADAGKFRAPIRCHRERAMGAHLGTLHNKPAALVTRLPGHAEMKPDGGLTATAVGRGCLRPDASGRRRSYRGYSKATCAGLSWWREVVPALLASNTGPWPRTTRRRNGRAIDLCEAVQRIASQLPAQRRSMPICSATMCCLSENGDKGPVVGGMSSTFTSPESIPGSSIWR